MIAKAAQTPSVIEVNNASFSTSVSADGLNDEFMKRLAFKNRNMVARLAIARSLAVHSSPAALSEERGKVIKGVNLFGDDLRTWLALILEHALTSDVSLEDVQDLIARHWARGLMLLAEDWRTAEEDFDRFILNLAAHAGLAIEGSGSIGGPGAQRVDFVPKATPVVLAIGEASLDQTTGERIEWTINRPGVSPHIAVMGMAGTGKTRIATTMLQEIRGQSGSPVLLFDMGKGDLSENNELVRALGATVIDPISQPIPLDVLYSTSDQVKQACMRFRESFKRVPNNRIGDAQGDVLREAAERAFAGPHPVRVRHIFEKLRQLYAEKRKKDDIVVATFKDMVQWELFEPDLPPQEFFARSWVIDLHKAPDAIKRLVVFLLFDAAYAFLAQQTDSAIDEDGHRAMRLVLAIDEARQVLGYQHQSLISLVRESRSKGGVMMFISQSPDDFDQKDENFLENIGLGVCFRTNARSSALNTLLGGPADTSGLPSGVCVTRLADRGLTYVVAWKQ
jgi:DNA sulfur modification protein DndE